jgi:hypothetical protein
MLGTDGKSTASNTLANTARAFLIVFSGAYTTKLGFSPIYVFVVAGIVGTLLIIWRSEVASLTAESMMALLIVGWLTLSQFAVGAEPPNILGAALGPAILALLHAPNNKDRPALATIAWWFIASSIALCAVETSYRLTHPDFDYLAMAMTVRGSIEDVFFYAYKYNSFMYLDSNFVGLQLALLLALQLAISAERLPHRGFMLIATMLLLIGTLSRASIVTATVLWCWHAFRRMRFAMLALLVLLLLALVALLPVLSADDSFTSKFEILEEFTQYIGRAGLPALVAGVGAGRAEVALGVGAHNIIVTYVVELGLVSSAMFLALWTAVLLRSRKTGYLFFVLLVNGFSLTSLAVPFLYASCFVVSELDATSGGDEHLGLEAPPSK